MNLLKHLLAREDILAAAELAGPGGAMGARKSKKLGEVAGFCEVILRYVRNHLAGRDPVRIVEFSCGKSYVGLVLSVLLRDLDGIGTELTGIDINADLAEKCGQIARDLGIDSARFVACRTRDFAPDGDTDCGGSFDLALALHACDTATDEAVAKGIELGVPLILVVPCCQNQIRGQIKSGHALGAITEYGVLRYRLANLLTDALRAQFLHSAGYHVEMQEIASPRLTPKNLCICARKVRRPSKRRRDEGYLALKEFFGVRPKIEKLCAGVIPEYE